MALTITDVHGVEILDSRGRPTLSVTMTAAGGAVARAGVPSGASTGSGEAAELRDGDPTRFSGLGITHALEHVKGEIAETLRGRSFTSFEEIDALLIDLDGTANKARLGANALTGVSMASARLFAVVSEVPLWQELEQCNGDARLPVPHFNVVNGGAHAPNELAFQEFMLAPLGARDMASAVRAGAEVYQALRRRLLERKLSVGLGDEGGFAPEIDVPEEVLSLLVGAISDAGYEAGRSGVSIALDPAANGFFAEGRYRVGRESLGTGDMIDRYEQIVSEFPVWSLEDGLAEGDDQGWVQLTERLGERIQIVGDDNFVTNPSIIAKAIERHIGNASLIKVNQIGTVTETLRAMQVCRDGGYAQMISHRSGETDDSFIADLAVGSGCGQIKSGAPARGERVAKYNRLLEIEDANRLPFGLAS
ncbi:MAG: phosphopyruvate hydratase [Nitrososphaerales archaeon]